MVTALETRVERRNAARAAAADEIFHTLKRMLVVDLGMMSSGSKFALSSFLDGSKYALAFCPFAQKVRTTQDSKMGKNRHSKDRLFVTQTEHKYLYGGKKTEIKRAYRRTSHAGLLRTYWLSRSRAIGN